jgi:predicted small metal-binding protein
MAYEFECRNLVPGCTGKVEAETRDEVLQKAAEHAAEVHGLTELDGATIQQVEAAIVATS